MSSLCPRLVLLCCVLVVFGAASGGRAHQPSTVIAPKILWNNTKAQAGPQGGSGPVGEDHGVNPIVFEQQTGQLFAAGQAPMPGQGVTPYVMALDSINGTFTWKPKFITAAGMGGIQVGIASSAAAAQNPKNIFVQYGIQSNSECSALEAFDKQTGELSWKIRSTQCYNPTGSTPKVFWSGERLYVVATMQTDLLLVDAASGEVFLRNSTLALSPFEVSEELGIVCGLSVYSATKMMCLNATTFEVLWSYSNSYCQYTYNGMAFSHRNKIFWWTCNNGTVLGFTALSGALVHNLQSYFPPDGNGNSPISDLYSVYSSKQQREVLLVPNTTGCIQQEAICTTNLCAVDVSSGKILWVSKEYQTSGGELFGYPSVNQPSLDPASDNIYFAICAAVFDAPQSARAHVPVLSLSTGEESSVLNFGTGAAGPVTFGDGNGVGYLAVDDTEYTSYVAAFQLP